MLPRNYNHIFVRYPLRMCAHHASESDLVAAIATKITRIHIDWEVDNTNSVLPHHNTLYVFCS